MSIQVFDGHTRKDGRHESICVDGMCFRFDRASVQGYRKRFRCCDPCCSARVLFNSVTDFKLVESHANCTFDHQRECRSRKRRDVAFNLLKQNMTEAPHQIVDRVAATMELTPAEKQALKMFVSRKRNELLGAQDVGCDDVVIPPSLKVTLAPQTADHPDNSFLLFDNGDDPTAPARIIVFASSDMRFKASLATELFADGTYRVVPRKFATLYTIHTLIDNVPYPIYFCLLENEREETFMALLDVIKHDLSSFGEGCVVHMDCQRSAMKAFQRTFDCNVKLCLFHVNQALWRVVVKNGLAEYYNNTNFPRLHAWVRRLMAFPFIKRERMVGCFESCFERMAVDPVFGVEALVRERFVAVVAYYKRFWLQEIGPAKICQYGERNRTNNHSEAFHRAVGRMVQIAHPQPLVMIRLLVQVEDDYRKKFDEQRRGKVIQRTNRRLDELNRLVENVMASHDDGLFESDIAYLSAVAKLYVEYGHITKTERRRNSLRFIRHSNALKRAVINALEEHNTFALEDDETSEEMLSSDADSFVETNYNSEILFDARSEQTASICNELDPSGGTSFRGAPHEVETRQCAKQTRRRSQVQKEARSKKPAKDVSGTPTRRRAKQKRLTLIQRMKMCK